MGGLSTLIAKKYGLTGNIVDCGVRDVGGDEKSGLSGMVPGGHSDHR